MESFSFLRITPFTPLQTPPPYSKNPTSQPKLHPSRTLSAPSTRISAALKSPRGFGPTPKKNKKQQQQKRTEPEEDDDDEEDEGEDPGTIPEVVTDRMMRRMGLSVGLPLGVGLMFFPFFYYLKAVVKVDVPTWVPFIVSFFFFGTALLGISYGIVSSSWDPPREGSLLGWNEARRNWPVFWESLRGRRK